MDEEHRSPLLVKKGIIQKHQPFMVVNEAMESSSTHPQLDRKQHKDIFYGALLVFILLLNVFLLTYSGVPMSDDEQLFAVVAQNLAASGEFRADQMLGNQRLEGRYGNIGPLHPLIGSWLMKMVWPAKALGTVQVVYFLSPIYTALTAALLYAYARLKNFSTPTSIFAALAFGLTTIAWPYAQTFYREPLAMLLLFGAFFIFEGLTQEIPIQLHPLPGWLIFSLCFFGAVLTKFYILLTLLLFLIKIFQHRARIFSKKWGGAIAVVLLFIMFGTLLFITTDISNHSRLQINFLRRIWQVIEVTVSEFNLSTTTANLGSVLFSPAKGFLIYSPVLALMLILLPTIKKKQRQQLLIPLGTFLIFLLTQTLTYQDKWWNISWSTRFMLPVVPLLFAAGLPGIAQALSVSKWTGRKIGLYSVTLIGFIIQLGGVLISDSVYLDILYNQQNIRDLSKTLWRFDLMPALQHWRLAFSGTEINLAFVRNFNFFPALVSILVLILTGAVGFAAVSLIRKPDTSKLNHTLMLGVYSLTILPLLMLVAYRFEPSYFPVWGNLNTAIEIIRTESTPWDIVIVDGYQRPAWYQLVNHGRLSQPWASLPENPIYWQSTVSSALAEASPASRVWFLVERERSTSIESVIEYSNGLKIICTPVKLITKPFTPDYHLLTCEFK